MYYVIFTVTLSNDVTSEQSEPSTSATETRRSQRVVKKPNTDLYVQGEEEIDNVSRDWFQLNGATPGNMCPIKCWVSEF